MAITPFRTTLPAHLGLSVQIDFFRYGIPPFSGSGRSSQPQAQSVKLGASQLA